MAKWFKSYRYRFKFTVDSDLIDAALTDFPVALHINSAAGTGDRDLTKVFDVAGARWPNLAVCGADGETPLWTEVDLWDATNETGVLHVRVPKISSSADADLYLYFDADGLGNGYIGATGSAAAYNVWDDDYAAVWHMNGDPSVASGIKNSVASANHLSGVNMESADSVDSGVIGKAVNFDGTNEYMVTGLSGLPLVNEEKTAEIVFNTDDTNRIGCASRLDYGGVNNDAKGWALSLDNGGNMQRLYHSGDGEYRYATGPTVDADSYVAVTCGINGATAALYVNGGAIAPSVSSLSTGSAETTSGYFSVGRESANYANGQISELRLSSVARSAAWLKATYNTLFDSLGAFSAVEAISAAPAGSWLSDWQSRIAFTIDSSLVDADLTDFPVALVLSATAGTGDTDLTAIFDALGANSHKIAVTDHTGLRQLFVEIDTWDESAETAVLHTKVPHVDADTDTLLYLYYDAAKADNDGYVGDIGDAPAQQVWDDDYEGVWHLGSDPTSAVPDSTSNGEDLTSGGSMTSGDVVDGKVGKALDLDGSNDYLTASISPPSQNTVEVLFYSDGDQTQAQAPSFLSWDTSGGNHTYDWRLGMDADEYLFAMWDTDTEDGTTVTSDTAYANLEWNMVQTQQAASNFKMFLNGSQVASQAISAHLSGTKALVIGRTYADAYASEHFFNGKVCEVRLSSVARSDAWLKATYHTLFDTIGAWSEAETYAGLGWLRGFTKRTRVAVDSTLGGASLDYFPVTLFLSSSCGTGSQDMTAIFDEIGANYKKLAVTAADGKTQLPVEIDYWDETGETAVLHVRVPSFDYGGDTYLYLYYSADVPDNDEHVGDVTEAPAMSVWDEHFKAVYHMNQDPSATTVKDSSIAANHLTMAGTMLTADLVDSAPGKGIDFDGTDDALYTTTMPVSGYPLTLEMKGMVEADGPGVVFADNSETNQMFALRVVTATDLKASVMAYNGGISNAFGTTVLTPSSNYYIAGVLNSATSRSVFTDGDDKQTDTTSCAFPAGFDRFALGAFLDSTPSYLDGDLSEVRVSDVARSDAWIKATHYSLSDGLVAYATDIETEDAWLGDWANRIQIRIDSANFASDASDYDFIVYLGAAVGANAVNTTAIFDALGANSLKIAAADAAGAQCAVSIEDWDETAETAILHVTVPTIFAARDTLIYLYYDAAKADNSGYVDELGAGASQDDDWAIFGATETLGGGWMRGWKYRRAFTVPSTNIDGDLSDFPLALILSTSAGTGDEDISSIFDELGENSKRIAVATAHGDKQVPVEIDTWDGAGESAVLHAKCPLVTAADGAVLYVYYDDDRYDDGFIGETGDAIAKRVWDDNFVAVWHMSQDPTGGAGCIKDSTSNDRTMSSAGSMTSGDLVTGQVGKQIEFDGSNDYFITTAVMPILPTITVEMLHYNGAAGTARNYVSSYDNTQDCNDWILIGQRITTGEANIATWVGGYADLPCASLENQPVHTVFTQDADDLLSLYVNGALGASESKAGDISTVAEKLVIGAYALSTSAVYRMSYVDEVRVSNVARSAAWLKATYYTLFDALAAWGAEGEEGEETTTIDEPLSKAGRIDFTPHSLTEVLSMTEALSKAGRIDFTPHSLSDSYTGNLLKMVDASGSRPKILTATGTKAQISAASGARPRLAAAEAYEYQERE